MTGAGGGLLGLSLNQATVKNLTLEQAVGLCRRHEIPAIGLWRDRVAELGLARAAAAVRAAGLHVSSLCRGGFFTHADPDARARYEALKRRNVEVAEGDIDVYVAAKARLVAELLSRAREERGMAPVAYWTPDG